MQNPPASSRAGPGSPVGQFALSAVHLPARQVPVLLAAQLWPHAPQFGSASSSVSQPSATKPLQSAVARGPCWSVNGTQVPSRQVEPVAPWPPPPPPPAPPLPEAAPAPLAPPVPP